MSNAAGLWPVVLAGVLTISASAQSVRVPVLLAGKPFPRVERFKPDLPAPRRTVPFTSGDLQAALCALEPGDRIVVAKGTYGALTIDGRCRDGNAAQPIQVAFDREAVLTGSITIKKSHWHFAGAHVRLVDVPENGLVVAASHVSLDGVQIAGATSAALRIAKGTTHVTVSNSAISTAGIEIESGTSDLVLANNRLHHNPTGSIRIRGARNITIRGNTIREDGATAILVARATNLQITANTLLGVPNATGARGIELHAVDDAVIRSNQISHYEVAISAGRVDPHADSNVHAVREITIDHNHLDSSSDFGTAIAIEAGSNIRFVNNVVNGYADAILLLGTRPFLSDVTVANNLVLGISRTAFVLRDPATAALFDFNVFSARNDAVEVEVDRATSTLARFLARGTMPRSEIASVRLFDRDLARLGGIETVDRGTAVANLPFAGKAPDLGVAER